MPSRPQGSVPDLEVHHESGEGSGAVYFYYFPAYVTQDGPFPIKVGMSERDPRVRICQQIGTGHPERPVVHRIHYTDDPRAMERLLHSALRLGGKTHEESVGVEWFLTRPEEIDDVLVKLGFLTIVPTERRGDFYVLPDGSLSLRDPNRRRTRRE